MDQNYTYLTVKEAAKYLKVSMETMYQLCRIQEFPSGKIGGRWILRQDLLDKWWTMQHEDKPMNF